MKKSEKSDHDTDSVTLLRFLVHFARLLACSFPSFPPESAQVSGLQSLFSPKNTPVRARHARRAPS